MIGPATNWVKKATNNAKSRQCRDRYDAPEINVERVGH